MRWLVLSLSLYSSFLYAAPCEKVLKSVKVESVAGRSVAVSHLTRPPGGARISVHDAFGVEPQILIGVDSSSSRLPYIIVGRTMFRISRSVDRYDTILIYNAATQTPLPQTITSTNYFLGAQPAEELPPGYFIRLTGLTSAEVERIEDRLRQQVTVGSSNTRLAQVWDLDVTQCRSPLESALLESDEIKRHNPPYNIVLKTGHRALVFYNRTFSRASLEQTKEFCIGPFRLNSWIENLQRFQCRPASSPRHIHLRPSTWPRRQGQRFQSARCFHVMSSPLQHQRSDWPSKRFHHWHQGPWPVAN